MAGKIRPVTAKGQSQHNSLPKCTGLTGLVHDVPLRRLLYKARPELYCMTAVNYRSMAVQAGDGYPTCQCRSEGLVLWHAGRAIARGSPPTPLIETSLPSAAGCQKRSKGLVVRHAGQAVT